MFCYEIGQSGLICKYSNTRSPSCCPHCFLHFFQLVILSLIFIRGLINFSWSLFPPLHFFLYPQPLSSSSCSPLFSHHYTFTQTLTAKYSNTEAIVLICSKTYVSSLKYHQIIKHKLFPIEVLVSAVKTYYHCPHSLSYTHGPSSIQCLRMN